jgi:glycosyltransferase involved in cell wall biosynthesis
MKKVLIASFDMEVGGVERSLISMLENFNYSEHAVDLMLYRHQGELMNLLPRKHTLLKEVEEYAAFRKSIAQIIKEKKFALGAARLLAKYSANLTGLFKKVEETGYYQMQRMWKYSLPFLPKLDKEYDAAISYLWPHYFVADKVKAKKKIAWIHTDYSTVDTDVKMDLKMWDKFDNIVAVSEQCKEAFLYKYPKLRNKTVVIENITSPEFINKMSNEEIEDIHFDRNSFNLLTVARLSHAKGIDNAVKALKLLHDRGRKNIKWYVVGYGGDEVLIRELINENNLQNSFILLGKKINPYPYMKLCDLYVQPSRYEGKAVTVTEAQILGKPVLITNYTTANSQIKDGVDGVITELSVEGIAKGIEKIYKDNNLRTKIENNCKSKDHSNASELKKLYKLFKYGVD